MRLQLSVDAKTYERLEALGVLQNASKSRIVDQLTEAAYKAAVNSNPVAVPAESVAQKVAVAARGLLPTRATGESTVAKLPPGKAGRKGKGAQR